MAQVKIAVHDAEEVVSAAETSPPIIVRVVVIHDVKTSEHLHVALGHGPAAPDAMHHALQKAREWCSDRGHEVIGDYEFTP